jgi:hypothetical protein
MVEQGVQQVKKWGSWLQGRLTELWKDRKRFDPRHRQTGSDDPSRERGDE